MPRLKAFVGRLALFVCGVFSVLVGRRSYGILRLFYPSDRGVCTIFFVTLVAVGVICIGTSLLPDSRVRAILKQRQRQESLLRLPVRLLVVFAAISYGVVALLALLPPSTHLSPLAVYSLCPSCALTPHPRSSQRRRVRFRRGCHRICRPDWA